MGKKIKCIGGPADGKEFDVSDTSRSLTIPYIDPDYKLKPITDETDLFEDVVGWDDYGPIFKHDYILQAKYKIYGNAAIYEE
jgi:hypothetical protein